MDSGDMAVDRCKSVTPDGTHCTLHVGHSEAHMAGLGGSRVAYWAEVPSHGTVYPDSASFLASFDELGSGATAAKASRQRGTSYPPPGDTDAPRPPHWAGEMEVARERTAEDLEYRRGRDEAWDSRMDEPRVLYDDSVGREW